MAPRQQLHAKRIAVLAADSRGPQDMVPFALRTLVLAAGVAGFYLARKPARGLHRLAA